MRALRFIALLVLICSSNGTTLAQKIKGVYFGDLISEKNTLIIKASGSELTGACYLNKTDRLDFSGTYIDGHLEGSIQLQDGSNVTLEGRIEDGSLKLNCLINNEHKSTSLVKFSSNERYDLNDVYSDRHDPLLVGKWETVKAIDKNGVIVSHSKSIEEFESNGRLTTQVITLAPELQGQVPSGLDPHKKVELTWYTEGTILTRTVINGRYPASLPYAVKGDTLIVYAAKNTVFHKRK
jgi:hypothetical protein